MYCMRTVFRRARRFASSSVSVLFCEGDFETSPELVSAAGSGIDSIFICGFNMYIKNSWPS